MVGDVKLCILIMSTNLCIDNDVSLVHKFSLLMYIDLLMAIMCYKWGVSGWQSSCYTLGISKYPLPMSSTTRLEAHVAGRKMSNGAYIKLDEACSCSL